jgi:hypothetical protein
MRSLFTRALLCLLGLHLSITSARPHESNDIHLSDSGTAADGYNPTSIDEHTTWEKRDPAPRVSLSQKPGWGKTWFAYVPEPADECWSRQTIADMAKQAYDSRIAQHTNGILIIAALWVPGTGAWFGSSVQGAGRDTLRANALTRAPRLWGQIQGRVYTGRSPNPNPSLYHGEDAAMYWYESNQDAAPARPRPNPYPAGTHLLAYGTRFASEDPGIRDLCSGTSTSITPSCKVVAEALHLTIG